ncbi:hypothetical protein FHS82_000703 [Pseudochelatococcus lubricantis]|uniref:Flagellar assembly protein FliH/Type III secretion system HrpE domain-containing protein n=1 Tax=Pseudochelatococcus lubricantis TaxID=1538102 RepID=A0ABX0UZ85_9HYPH|nr:hypothetical protein [Pseudochelatococcus lubricantis]NIJ56890.1 hypothetical protein [Pseudochelatococcus lubricantis]
MKTSLAACLPDFDTDDSSGSIADSSGPQPAAPTEPPPPAPRAEAGRLPPGARIRSASSKLLSVARPAEQAGEPFIAPLIDPAPPVDIEALLKEHGDKVRREAAGKAEATLAEALGREREAHAGQLAEARAQWVAEESTRLTERMTAALQEIEDGLSGTVARMFTPFLKQAIREKAAAALHRTVAALLGDVNHARIEISGPGDLIDAIRGAVMAGAPGHAGRIAFTVTEKPDVRVVAGSTVCLTQLDVWNGLIEEALGGHADT